MARPRILVIDDSVTVLQVLEGALAASYDVVTAADGLQGFEIARAVRPDLIVTDNIMPGLGGFALIDRLRTDPATAAIPAIVLTSEDADGPPAHAGLHPPAAVVTKSFDTGPLLTAIATALASRIAL